MTGSVDVAPTRAGRPTRDQADARHRLLLDRALDHFLEKGFEIATIEAIAQDVGMTKRTIYARYADKTQLFRAALDLAITRFSVSQADLDATDTGETETTLIALARLRVAQVETPNGLRLQRIINTESYRFPGIFMESFERSGLPTVRFLTAVLQRGVERGELTLDDPRMAAGVFMSMVVGGPVRAIVLGERPDRSETDDRIRYAVRLFLNGARSR